jgi:hypothetical protein
MLASLGSTLRQLGEGAVQNLQDTLQPDIVELAPRLVLCGFPGGQVANAHPDRSLRALPSPAKLRAWLEKHFPGAQFVVWNLSGLAYDYDALGGKVVVYAFPSHPVPPLDALAEIATSVHDWLSAKGDTGGGGNVAVLHDISGRRAAVVGACAQQLGQARRRSLESIVLPLGHVGRALVPTQHRFFDYFCSTVAAEDGRSHLPAPRALILSRLIVNGVPDFALHESCRPCLRVLDASQVVGGTAPSFTVRPEDLSFSLSPVSPCPGPPPDTGSGPFAPTVLLGDVLLRVYHAKPDGELVAMFAVGFHTSFVPDPLVLRFAASDVDGAIGNSRFPPDFFLDLIFAEPGPEPLQPVFVHPVREGGAKAPSDDSVGDTLDEINKLLGDADEEGLDEEGLDDSEMIDVDDDLLGDV